MKIRTCISFINCARGPSEIIFRSELEYLARFMPNLSLGFIVEERGQMELWSGLRGRIDKAKIGLLAHDFLDRTVFCCGPDMFMNFVSSSLEAAGFDMSRYHEESFSAPVDGEGALLDTAGPLETLPQAGAAAKIVFKGSGVEAECLETDTILKIAKEIGLNIPSACTFGVCGTCRVEKLSGEVHMAHNGGISEDEIEEGFILACCSRPIGRVEVDV